MKVLVADKISDTGIEKLHAQGYEVDVKTGLAEDELVAIIPEYDAMIVRSATKATRRIIEAGERLRSSDARVWASTTWTWPRPQSAV